ncbi:DNA cytosine methyltransferase [Pseudoroseicyclus tamaricis]|uniref:Cytosine-specific methyltransferase n=1 Tax=Pseudoroseicyclus tamaricis TaxID=2705421 RepID=A0A6B2K7D5_9RHOB|nr:DNA (cytosine-5-)-methyltransferase [Pseudoroseicyclus tamaricis]NDV02896.1 DNA cytosine methyltransferase [Pseudoroseicyclus tamaricis]
MKFIDLFAGLGGFHRALANLGHECVMASELDPLLVDLYERNHGLRPRGDVTSIPLDEVPEHDVLCAGFPCQPFSKAGAQLGRDYPGSGTLFDNVLRILRKRRPGHLILENVPNLLRHDQGRTWAAMERQLAMIGYDVRSKLLSPHMFGVPQVRDRAIIVAKQGRGALAEFEWPGRKRPRDELDIHDVLDERPNDAKALPSTFLKYLDAWQRFLDAYPDDVPLPSFPIWAMEFGATYPYVGHTPASLPPNALKGLKGAFGEPLTGSHDQNFALLPPYAQESKPRFAGWKERFISQNRELYGFSPGAFDAWLPSIRGFAPSFQKLEWNWKDGPRDIRKGIIQFRASGIRVKRPTVAPSLVALTTSQVPVVGWEERYMTVRECARLQSMGDFQYMPHTRQAAYKALGNAVNVGVIQAVAARLLGQDDPAPTIH